MDFSIYDVINHTVILAQVIEDPDIIGQMSDAWKNFVETGQIWALLIGMFFGYTFANFTRF
ncbi:hypothetical protein [Geminocystis sp. NIES-3709]|uniref:hypothetical protein n=1 Tax=Geminocystis sp. NIES-3709 TaxID=1617448 RepID=UPI0005FC801C|nr:hypothetical protein [Geminocystis sp. NIES-3709]BAQ63858.1 Asr3886 protein [Geminocystis sp. NIES-3709]